MDLTSAESKATYVQIKSHVCQFRMYGEFILGYLSVDEESLIFIRDEAYKDDNWTW